MLTKENIAGLAELVDKAKEWKNPFLEGIDGMVAKGLIKLADNYLDEFIPVEFHEDVNEAVTGVLEKDYETAIKELMELIAEILIKYVVPKLGKTPA
jgi:hypothetical protein